MNLNKVKDQDSQKIENLDLFSCLFYILAIHFS